MEMPVGPFYPRFSYPRYEPEPGMDDSKRDEQNKLLRNRLARLDKESKALSIKLPKQMRASSEETNPARKAKLVIKLIKTQNRLIEIAETMRTLNSEVIE